MNKPNLRIDAFTNQPCEICKSKSQFEVKIARTSNHIFLRAQVCSTKCAEEWIELQVEKLP